MIIYFISYDFVIGNWLANIHIVNDTAVVSQQKVKDIVSSCWLQHLSS